MDSTAGDVFPTFDYGDERIPPLARERIDTILTRIREVETAIRRQPVQASSEIELARMRDVHLPRLVRSYVDIPAAHRGEIFRRTGKSASFVLVDSLDRMLRHLDSTLEDIANLGIDAFTTNTRFVAQRFSDEADPFS
ncbi:hypothetical protein [Sphingomonas sp.]|uniref:hypothetical protein n=1 Tax=Sphingomonas sp. TaxID=28214 RepID=UPI000DBBCE3A|nr:hypothetical protein [Sphingomonas sp.]PZT94000.1 MAG: hypothetical protein DI625_07555 [Sphingomonas sp.]